MFPSGLSQERALGNLNLVSSRHHLLYFCFFWDSSLYPITVHRCWCKNDYVLSLVSPSMELVNSGVVYLGNTAQEAHAASFRWEGEKF